MEVPQRKNGGSKRVRRRSAPESRCSGAPGRPSGSGAIVWQQRQHDEGPLDQSQASRTGAPSRAAGIRPLGRRDSAGTRRAPQCRRRGRRRTGRLRAWLGREACAPPSAGRPSRRLSGVSRPRRLSASVRTSRPPRGGRARSASSSGPRHGSGRWPASRTAAARSRPSTDRAGAAREPPTPGS